MKTTCIRWAALGLPSLVDDQVVVAAPSEVVLQNSQSLQLRRKRRPRWGLDVPLAQEEVEKVQVQLALSSSHHQLLIAAGSSSQSDVGPTLVELLVLEGIDHPWA